MPESRRERRRAITGKAVNVYEYKKPCHSHSTAAHSPLSRIPDSRYAQRMLPTVVRRHSSSRKCEFQQLPEFSRDISLTAACSMEMKKREYLDLGDICEGKAERGRRTKNLFCDISIGQGTIICNSPIVYTLRVGDGCRWKRTFWSSILEDCWKLWGLFMNQSGVPTDAPVLPQK